MKSYATGKKAGGGFGAKDALIPSSLGSLGVLFVHLIFVRSPLGFISLYIRSCPFFLSLPLPFVLF
jgi:hypothetical protein